MPSLSSRRSWTTAQADGLHRPVPHGVHPALGEYFNRHTALVHLRVAHVKVVHRRALRLHKSLAERLVGGLVEGAVEIGVVAALVVAGRAEDFRPVEAFRRHDGGGGVEKAQRPAAQLANLLREGVAGERARRDDRDPLPRELAHLHALADMDARMLADALRHKRGEGPAVDGERAARRDGARLRALDEKRAEAAHFLLEQAGGALNPRGLERIRADKLREERALVGGGIAGGLHLDELGLLARLGNLPRGLAAGESGSNYLYHSSPSSTFSYPHSGVTQ